MALFAPPSAEREVPAGAIDPGEEAKFLEGFNPDLPPFGQIGDDDGSHGQAYAYLIRIAREADEARTEPIKAAVDCAKIYQQGTVEKPDVDTAIANDIQTTVISITDIETRDPFAVFIRPVQTQDKAQVFWIGPPVTPEISAVTGLPPGLGMVPVPMQDPMTGAPAVDQMGQPAMTLMPADPNAMPQQLDEVTAWQLRKSAAMGTFPAEWLGVVDNRALADVYQTVFDAQWIDANIDDWIVENTLKCNIFGYQTAFYTWDDQLKRHIVRDVSIKQAYLDPNAEGSSFDLQNCPAFDLVLDVDKAKADFPQLAPLIDAYGKIGNPSRVDSTSQFGVASDRAFYRRTVTMRFQWFCNQVVPMLPREAIEAGLMEQDEQTGKYFPLQDQQAAGVAQEPPQWPMTYGVRQMMTMALTGRIVQDIRCEHWAIPMLLNVCIPLPGSPFGQGLPEKLKGLQHADIVLLNSVLKYARTFANPGCAIPKSVGDALGKGLKRTHIDPTETLQFPDDLVQRFGDKAVMWFSPPALPPAVPDAMHMITERAQRTSGHPEVMSGTAPSPTSSGKMVEALQAGAANQFGFQAKWTAKMVERLCNLMHYKHVWNMEAADIAKIYKRLPLPLIELLVQMARSSRWENQVDVNAGAGGTTNKRLQRALALFQARSSTGEPVMTLQSVREAASLDHEEESLKYRNELMTAAPMAPAPGEEQPGQGEPANSENGQAEPSSNGNGRF